MVDCYNNSQNIMVDSAEPIWIRNVNKELNSLTELSNNILLRWKNNYERDRTNDALVEFYCILFNIKF